MKNSFKDVYSAFRAGAARWSDRPFLHIPLEAASAYSPSAVDLTYGEADRRISQLIHEYTANGMGRGHRVATLLDNRVDFFLHYLALNSLGASLVPLNAEASPAELGHVLKDSASVAVVALEQHQELARSTASLLTQPLALIWLNEVGIAWSAATGAATAADDEAALLYTSGSTGAPKGCILSNEYMLTMGEWYRGVGGLCTVVDGQERLITPLPLVHMNALAASSMVMILSGGCIIQLDRFHPCSWWSTVRAAGATIVHYLGVMPAILLQLPQSADETRHTVKFGFGAGVHPKHHSAFEDRFDFPLVESWSMTEVGGGAAVIANTQPRHVGERCFGRPGPNMEFRVVDEKGHDVAAGESGELWVRAAGANPRAGFFSGYTNQPELTEAAWEHGYFHTGDIVRQGPDEALHFVDRKKSIIRRSGENIASLEVEAVLNQLPGVRGVGVGPVDDEMRGEEVMACIRLTEGTLAEEETATALFNAASEKLVYFKLPGYIAFVPELPLTASQKLQRGQLKTLSHNLVRLGKVFDLRERKKRPTANHK